MTSTPLRSHRIVPEHHISPPVIDHWGNRHPGLSFEYAIHRPDGSHLFRTQTFAEARDLVARLLEPGVLAR